MNLQQEFPSWAQALEEIQRLRDLINTPRFQDFLIATHIEAVHQIERWGEPHDRAKKPEDWLFLLGFLATKACVAHREGDINRALHHTISSAAALMNWHSHLSGDDHGFTPGDSDIQKMVRDVWGIDDD